MIVDDFDIMGASSLPYKTDPILVVDPDTVHSLTFTSQRLQSITRRNPQLLQCFNRV